MAKFCQNIEDLEIWDCGEAIPGLINFIDNQKNLRSLALHCHKTTRILQLSEVIERKADTLIKFVCMLIENSHGNIKNIDIRNNDNFGYTKRLYKSIAINCPKIESLAISIQFKNLGGIKEIFLNCTRLNILELYIVDIEDEEDNCDEILNILADYSPKTFKIFSFNKDFIFSVDGLQNFFENGEIIEKYFDEGVVDINPWDLYHN
ncbi:unnamed protein product [Rhizophagus irregularis]|nr:unnamed protein product [Rhizophagus irregularis]